MSQESDVIVDMLAAMRSSHERWLRSIDKRLDVLLKRFDALDVRMDKIEKESA